jgi:MFS family permease
MAGAGGVQTNGGSMARAERRHPHAAGKFITYSSLVGAVSGLFQLGEVIAYKSLKASAFSVTLLTMANPIANFTSLWWGRILVGRDQSRILKAAAVGCGVVLASGLVLTSVPHLIALYFFYYAFMSLTYTTENRALQQHIAPARTGVLFGIAAGVRTGLGALVAAGAGFYMDADPIGYCHLFGAAAIVCAIGILQLAMIPTTRNGAKSPARIRLALLVEPLMNVIPLLRARKDFLRFEIAFMIYGAAYMMAMPVLPVFLVKTLALDYTTIGIARGGIHFLFLALAMPVFGHIYDRTTPHRLSAVMFFILTFFPLALVAAAYHEGAWRLAFLYAGFAIFGITMGGVNVLWSLSSIRFAGHEDVALYHSVHVAATGVRGLFAPLLGFALMDATSPVTALIVIAAVWLFSSVAVLALRVWDIRTGAFRPLRPAPEEWRAAHPDVEAHM